jgi:SAM-dependent methyltransferase
MGRYYERYYTHADKPETKSISGITLKSSVLKRLADGWRNAKYGTRRPSYGIAGALLISGLWPLRQWLMAECRHIPPPRLRSLGYRVLDVGFGDGRFLRFAQESGCLAVGMEIDTVAAAAARDSGLDVHVGDIQAALERFGAASFDFITMSHVIEHVHEPRKALACAAELLKPGGRLWIETPNPDSFGYLRFSHKWRDLDPPRHLCLMTEPALVAAASAAGLDLFRRYRRPFVTFEVYPFSSAACNNKRSAFYLRLRCAWDEWLSTILRRRQEWLTLAFQRRETDN